MRLRLRLRLRLREAPLRDLLVHRTLAPTEEPRRQNCGGGLYAGSQPTVRQTRSLRRAQAVVWVCVPPEHSLRKSPLCCEFGLIADLVASRIAGNRGEFTTRDTVSPRRPWRGAPGFPGDVGNGRRMEARQGAIRIFSGNSIVFRSAAQPTIPASPDARSREASPRTSAAGTHRPFRALRLCKIAHQVFVEAGSGALPAGIAADG